MQAGANRSSTGIERFLARSGDQPVSHPLTSAICPTRIRICKGKPGNQTLLVEAEGQKHLRSTNCNLDLQQKCHQ